MLVDYEPGMLDALRRALRNEGYRMLCASNGTEALELLALSAVQVIVCDQRMPDMSGTEFLNVAKRLYPETIRIILTGHTDLEVVADSVSRGAVYKSLTKPWDDDVLKQHIRDGFLCYRPRE